MLEWFLHFSDIISQGFQHIIDFLYENTVGILKGLCIYYLKITAVFMYVKLRLGIDVAIELFDAYIAPIDLKGPVDTAWSAIPNEIRSFLCYLRFPDAVAIILSAHALRLIRAMIPFLR